MKAEKVWATLERYDRELEAQAYKVKQFDRRDYDFKGILPASVMLAHCRWMAQHCLKVFKAEYESGRPLRGDVTTEDIVESRAPLEKAMRWLCYIQGVCHTLGLYTCNELRDHSREEGTAQTPGEKHADELERACDELLLYSPDAVAARAALDVPRDKRTPEQVDLLQRSVLGCCNRNADNQGCSCMAEALSRRSVESEKKGPQGPQIQPPPRGYGASNGNDRAAE